MRRQVAEALIRSHRRLVAEAEADFASAKADLVSARQEEQQLKQLLAKQQTQPGREPGKNLLTVKALAEKTPFTEGQFRAWIYDAERNGFSGCVTKIGRRIYIDEDQLSEWLAAHRLKKVS